MSKHRLGLLAYASSTGLGYQTHAYYKHLKPSKTMVIDLSRFNNMPLHPEWYPDAWRFVRGLPTAQDCDEFLQDIDCLLVAETPLNYHLFDLARQRRIKTVLHYNYEFLDYMHSSHHSKPLPDILAAPTAWNIDAVHQLPGAHTRELPVPIDLDELPQRTITQARRFFHIAGRPAVHDRNGTLDFIAAAKHVAWQMPEAEFILYCQQPTPEIERALIGAPIKVVGQVDEPADMYREGDVLILPRRYGGLCLPAQEAIGCGVPVIMPAISPNRDWMPLNWLVPVQPQGERFMARCPIDIHSIVLPALTNRMLYLYRNDAEVQHMHAQAKELAQQRSWTALKPVYDEVLGS